MCGIVPFSGCGGTYRGGRLAAGAFTEDRTVREANNFTNRGRVADFADGPLCRTLYLKRFQLDSDKAG
jgi:hypothetical protein